MGFKIEDSTGTGYGAKVTSKNRLSTSSIMREYVHAANLQGNLYHHNFDTTVSGSEACISYTKNTSNDYLVINNILLSVTGAFEMWTKVRVDGTPSEVTEVEPVNVNAGSGNLATGEFYTANNSDGIQGLSGGDSSFRLRYFDGVYSTMFPIGSKIILPKNTTAALYVDTKGDSLNFMGHINFNYEEGESF